jgi:hypothetical protein
MPITVSGTSITFNDSTTQTTAFTGGGGTVTSVATGNGLSGGTITTTGTLSVACPGFNTVGSYVFGRMATSTISSLAAGATVSAGTGNFQVQAVIRANDGADIVSNNLSGSWRLMAAGIGGGDPFSSSPAYAIFCRIS